MRAGAKQQVARRGSPVGGLGLLGGHARGGGFVLGLVRGASGRELPRGALMSGVRTGYSLVCRAPWLCLSAK